MYDKAELDLIRRAVTSFDWVNSLVNLGTSEQVDLFNDTLLNIFRNFIPHKFITCHYKDPPWITMEDDKMSMFISNRSVKLRKEYQSLFLRSLRKSSSTKFLKERTLMILGSPFGRLHFIIMYTKE